MKLTLSGIDNPNPYLTSSDDSLDVIYENGYLHPRNDDVSLGLSGAVCYTSTGLAVGNFAWGTDAYTTTPSWKRNGTSLSLPSTPSLSVAAVSQATAITGSSWEPYYGSTSGTDAYCSVSGGTLFLSQYYDNGTPGVTHSAKMTLDSQDWSAYGSLTINAKMYCYGSSSAVPRLNTWQILVNGDAQTITEVVHPNYDRWQKGTFNPDAAQSVKFTFSTDNIATPASVTSIEIRVPIWDKPDEWDGFQIQLPLEITAEATVGVGSFTYLSTLVDSNGIESAASSAVTVDISAGSFVVNASISGTATTARLYKAVAGSYGLIASGSASSGLTLLQDTGQEIGDIYRPGTLLPTGESNTWGNRAVVYSGKELYISAANMPTKFAPTALNEDGQDGWALTLPEAITAVDVVGSLRVHTLNHTYTLDGSRLQYQGDSYGAQLPKDEIGRGIIAANGGVEVNPKGIFVNNRLEFEIPTTSALVLVRDRAYCCINNYLYVKTPGMDGWYIWSLPIAPTHLCFDGTHLVVSNSSGSYRIASASSRKSGYWMSGKMSSIQPIRGIWLHTAGDYTFSIYNQSTQLFTTAASGVHRLQQDPALEIQFRLDFTSNQCCYFADVEMEKVKQVGSY